MRVKILKSLSGPHETYTGGKEYNIADARAEKLIARGLAVAVHEEKKPARVVAAPDPIEMAVANPPPETATAHRRAPRRK